MARHRDTGNSIGQNRHSRYSTSLSPEPYKERDRGNDRQRRPLRRRKSSSQTSSSSGRGHGINRERDGHRHTRSARFRSSSPRSSSDREKRQSRLEKTNEEDRQDDAIGINRMKRHHRSDPEEETSHYKHGRKSHDTSPRKSRALPSQEAAFMGDSTAAPSELEKEKQKEKQKPNFSATGRLAADSNTVKSSDGQAIVLKYHEPVEARKPPVSQRWRVYVFKGPDIMDTIELSERTCWLFGRENAVVDCLIEHPSCSKQHAVIQFRYVEKRNEFGDRAGRVKPYLIDLESANGTSMNGEGVPAGRYLELRNKDVVKFGHSTREYLIQLPA